MNSILSFLIGSGTRYVEWMTERDLLEDNPETTAGTVTINDEEPMTVEEHMRLLEKMELWEKRG